MRLLKKLFLASVVLLGVRIAWSDSKVTALTADTTAQAADLVYKVDSPAGTPQSRSITLGNLFTQVAVSSLTAQPTSTGQYTNANVTVNQQGLVTAISSGSAGYALEPATVTIQSNKGEKASTMTITGLGPGVLHTLVTSSNVVVAQVSLSTEVTGLLPLGNLTNGGIVSLSTGVTGLLPLANLTNGGIVSVSTGVVGLLPLANLTNGGIVSLATGTVGIVAGSAVGPGSTNYVQIGNTLQTSSTFYVSSGTVQNLSMSSGTIQPTANGNALVIFNSTRTAMMTFNTSAAGLTAMFQVQDSTGRILIQVNGMGHVVSQSTAPILSSCGTSPTLTTNSNDHKGTVTSGATAGGCTLTFGNAYATAPSCVVTERVLSLVNAMSYTTSTLALTITETSSGGVIYDYICEE